MTDAEVDTGAFAGVFLEDRNHDIVHGAWKDGAAYDHGVPCGFVLECLPDLLADAADVTEVEIAVGLAGRADTHKGQFRLTDCLGGALGGAKAPDRTPASIRSPISASMIGDSPLLMRSTLVSTGSTPMTVWPSLARQPADTVPT